MRELGNTFGATAYASGIMLAAFMTGLGIGSLLGGRLAERTKRPLRAAARAELAIGAFSIVALLGIVFLPGWFYDTLNQPGTAPAVFIGVQFAVAFAVMLLPTTAMGLTFPLVMEGIERTDQVGRWAGMLYSANTAGGIAGAFVAGFGLIPLFGTKGALVYAAGLSICAAWMLARVSTNTESTRPFLRSPEGAVALVVMGLLIASPAPEALPISMTLLGRFDSAASLVQQVRDLGTVVYDKESVYSRVSVVHYPSGNISLRNGALIEGSNSGPDKATTMLLAAIPLMSAATTSSAMVVGLGTGYTSGNLLYLNTPRVTTVEINPAIPGAMQVFLGSMLIDDPHWRLVMDDARSRLLTSDDSFDVITSEPSWPLSASVAPLFTREFMQAARDRLKPGGVFCQWLPNYLLTRDDLKMMYKTMRSVYPRVDVWRVAQPDGSQGEIILVGFLDAKSRPQAAIAARVSAAMHGSGLDKSFAPEAHMGDLEAAVTDPSVPLNTDDHSRLEYSVVWNFLANRSIASETK